MLSGNLDSEHIQESFLLWDSKFFCILCDLKILFFNLLTGVPSIFSCFDFEVNILSFVCAGINFEC